MTSTYSLARKLTDMTHIQLEEILNDLKQNYPEAFEHFSGNVYNTKVLPKGLSNNMNMLIKNIAANRPSWYTDDWIYIGDIQKYIQDQIKQNIPGNVLTRQLNMHNLLVEKMYKSTGKPYQEATTFVKLVPYESL